MADVRVGRCHCGRTFVAKQRTQKYCSPDHRPKPEIGRKSSAERGYGYAHRKRRAALLPFAYGTPCPLCGNEMIVGDRLDLDHSTPKAVANTVGDRMAHSSCNQLAGAKLGKAIQRQRAEGTPPSRSW